MLIRRVARPMLSATFISRGVEALRSLQPAADATRQTLEGLSQLPDPVGANVPSNAETVARVNAAVQIGGGLLLATGRLPRLASVALAVSVVPGSLGGHAFWKLSDPRRRAEERRALIADVSLIGGLMIAAVDTEGKPSISWRGRRAAHKMSDAMSDAVASALPAGASGGSLADIARERGVEVVEAARERAAALADTAETEVKRRRKA